MSYTLYQSLGLDRSLPPEALAAQIESMLAQPGSKPIAWVNCRRHTPSWATQANAACTIGASMIRRHLP